MNKILEEDLINIINNKYVSIEKFKNKNFLITGATGLIGSLLVKTLACANNKLNLNIKIYALVRNEKKAKLYFSDFSENSNISFVINDVMNEVPSITDTIDYIVHTACVTNSKLMVTDPIGTIKTSVFGTDNILQLGVQKNARTIYLSSMEVYGDISDFEGKVNEEYLGKLDLNNIRTCYPESKRLCELLCKAYVEQLNQSVLCVRLAQCFGPGILPTENRVFAQFARSVIEKKDIILHTDGMSEGNYIYTSDAIIAILFLLQYGVCGETYNINNENSHCTIRDMANMVSKEISNESIKVIFDIPKNNNTFGYAPKVKLHMSSSKLNQLGWKAEVNLKDSYERLIKYMKES